MSEMPALSSSPPSVCGFCDGGCGLSEPRATKDASLEELVSSTVRGGIEGVQQLEITDVTDSEHVRLGSKDGRAIADGGAQHGVDGFRRELWDIKVRERCHLGEYAAGTLRSCFGALR